MSTASESKALVGAVRLVLRSAADPSKAPAMQAYMKSSMPYLGVPTPRLRAACRGVFAERLLSNAESWRTTALVLWREARYREERYAAIELCSERRYRAYQSLEMLPVYEEMIVTGAWWDYVDAISSHLVGGLLRAYPATMKRAMRGWSRSGDLWKRRSAILCQLHFKGDTDLELLYACIEPAIAEKEFFLRKAIGWALREYSKTDAAEIRRYVKANQNRLSPLSQREALKVVNRA